jgi:hypothetical protein
MIIVANNTINGRLWHHTEKEELINNKITANEKNTTHYN